MGTPSGLVPLSGYVELPPDERRERASAFPTRPSSDVLCAIFPTDRFLKISLKCASSLLERRQTEPTGNHGAS
jgi:hypothetical protein